MIKSQDELNTCNDGHRSSSVLLETIEKGERLQKQLDIAIKCLKEYEEDWYVKQTLDEIKELEK